MNRFWMRGAAAIWLLLAAPSPSQDHPIAGERAKLLQNYRDAFDAWLRADTLLEDTTNPRERLSRAGDAKEKWSVAAAAKSRYLDAIRSLHRNRAAALGSLVSRSPHTAQVQGAGQNTLADLSTDLNSLDRQIKTEARSLTQAQRAALRNQRRALAALHELYRSRQQALEELHQNDALVEKSSAALAARHRALADAMTAQNENGPAESSWWIAAYEQMRRRAVEQAEAAPPAPAPSKPPAPPPLPAFAGEWTLANPRPEKFSDATGPLYGDVDVQVRIARTGGRISGTYSGVVFVPPGERYNPGVRFSFSGPVGSGPVIEARIESPLSGVVRLELVDERRIRISYRIDRTPASAGISFKIGEPKELLRKRGVPIASSNGGTSERVFERR